MQGPATRWLQIAGLPKTLNSAYLLEHIFGEYGSLQGMWARRLTTEGIIIVGYNDSRDALRAFKALRHKRFFNERLLTAHFVPRQLIQALAPQGTDVLLSCNVGEVSIAVNGHGECPKDVLYSLFCSYGDIKAFRFCDEEHGSYMLCDYFDLRDAALAVQELDNKRVRDCTLMVRFVAPDDAQDPPTAAHAAFDRRTAWDAFGHLSPLVLDSMGRSGQSAIPVWFTPDLHPSWSAMTALERSNSWQTFEQEQKHRAARFIDSNRRASVVKMPTSIAEQQQQPRSSPLAYAVSSHSTPTPLEPATGYFDLPRAAASSLTPVSTPLPAPSANDALKASLLSQLARFTPSTGTLGTPGDLDRNSVKPDRVTQGQDVRTTIMIKNIPNKFTQSMLKDWLDETSPGCYDFLYLRIDFQNKCNVGYAFVNFIDARDILTFYEKRVGTCWHVFSSEKRCDISYANIQGREKLVEKFRNSSVMDQDPAFRPKLFHTAGTSKGYEEPFPACNDPKMKARSTLDAQTTGLFPPVGSLSSSRIGTPLRPPSVRGDRGTGAASPATGLLTPPLSTRLGQRLEQKETPAQSPLAKMVVRPSSKRA